MYSPCFQLFAGANTLSYVRHFRWVTYSLLPVFVLLALSSATHAVTPAPDGGYPNSNTAEGDSALFNLTSGFEDTAIGHAALLSNTVGSFNTASGANALFSNISGGANTANGDGALASNTIGSDNTASGFEALANNTTGYFNTATGSNALLNNVIASNNTAVGYVALLSNTKGNNNTAIGYQALVELTRGSNNIALGANAGIKLTTGSNNIDISAEGRPAEANTIRIGRRGVQKTAYMQGISGATVASGVTVIVGSNGQLGTIVSSARFKEAIKPMDKASEAILALKPVTFRYKEELDPDKIPQFGLIAEEVEKVNPDLVVRDEDGKVNTVRYEAVNAMLLNEFLKEHRKVEEQGAIIGKQQKQIDALTAGLEKVTARVEAANSVTPIVTDN